MCALEECTELLKLSSGIFEILRIQFLSKDLQTLPAGVWKKVLVQWNSPEHIRPAVFEDEDSRVFCHVRSVQKIIFRGWAAERQTAGFVYVSHEFIVVKIGSHGENVSERTNAEQSKWYPEGEGSFRKKLFFLSLRNCIFHQAINENNHLSNVFVWFNLTRFLFLVGLSFLQCHSLFGIHPFPFCNQIGLSYRPAALWLLPAGFRCLQSGQQANDCGAWNSRSHQWLRHTHWLSGTHTDAHKEDTCTIRKEYPHKCM